MRILIFSVAAFLFITQLNFAQEAKKDLERLQGSWQVVEVVRSGQTFKDKNGKLVITGARMTMDFDMGQERNFTFQVDEKAKPKTIDLTALDGNFKGELVRGIYRFDGDTLQLCVPNLDNKDRPKEFAAPKEDENLLLITLKRDKKPGS